MTLEQDSLSDSTDAQALLSRIRAGHESDIGRLFEKYRNYIRVVASMGLPDALQGKLDSSDIVQETFVRAHKGFKQFRGETEAEFRGWMHQILTSELADQGRRFIKAKKRDARMEVRLRNAIDQSSSQLDQLIVSPDTSPSQMAAKHENGLRLADALQQLTDEERQVVVLYRLKGHSYAEVARRLGMSVDRVYRLWIRAIEELKNILETE